MALSDSVDAALTEATTEAQDGGTVMLARYLAAAIDEAPDPIAALERLGPKLLAVLEALGMSPRARATAAKGATGGPVGNPLDELRARRHRRAAGED
jgi:hypothetical protein